VILVDIYGMKEGLAVLCLLVVTLSKMGLSSRSETPCINVAAQYRGVEAFVGYYLKQFDTDNTHTEVS
jgi:hypothetical protein